MGLVGRLVRIALWSVGIAVACRGRKQHVFRVVRPEVSKQLFEFLRQFELAILRLPGAGRRYIHEQLHRIMKLVFDEFPLTTWNMKVVEVREDSVSLPYIASELELSELYPEPEGITGSEKPINGNPPDEVRL
jgi:hypothetical protein